MVVGRGLFWRVPRGMSRWVSQGVSRTKRLAGLDRPRPSFWARVGPGLPRARPFALSPLGLAAGGLASRSAGLTLVWSLGETGKPGAPRNQIIPTRADIDRRLVRTGSPDHGRQNQPSLCDAASVFRCCIHLSEPSRCGRDEVFAARRGQMRARAAGSLRRTGGEFVVEPILQVLSAYSTGRPVAGGPVRPQGNSQAAVTSGRVRCNGRPRPSMAARRESVTTDSLWFSRIIANPARATWL